ncbi:MAG: hypothetical protein ACYSWX_02615 [Planctomycetota bacterium]|jgi:hypothetical protein
MNRLTLRGGALGAAAAVLATTAAAQTTYRTIAEESFDLPPGTFLGDTGSGIGWEAPWYAGPTGLSSFVFSPGFDAVGGSGLTNNPDPAVPGEYESYRRLDLTGFENITDSLFGSAQGPLLGKDDTTLWLRFTAQRFFGGDDAYAGVSLFIFLDPNGVGEYLFMGSPYLFDDYGIDTTLSGQGPGAISCGKGGIDTETDLVYRIDFLPGDERVRMWVNPAEEYPTGPADLDAIDVPDFRFNELRFASGTGGGTAGGLQAGWLFDGIKLECENCPADPDVDVQPPTMSVATGGTSTLILNAGPDYADKLYYLAGTLSGTSPGVPVGNFILPLNPDPYFLMTLKGGPPITNGFAQLDSSGRGAALFTLGPGITALTGLTAHHAFVVVDLALGGAITFASDAGALDFTP